MARLFDRPAAIAASIALALFAAVLPVDIGGPVVVLWSLICAAAIFGTRRTTMRGNRPIATLLAATITLIAVGNIIRGLEGAGADGVAQLSFSIADLFQIPAYLGFAFVAWQILRSRSLRREPEAWLDAIAVVLALFLALWLSFLGDFLLGSGLSGLELALNSIYNTLSLAGLVIVLRIVATPGPRPIAYRVLGFAYVAGFIADVSTAISVAEGSGVKAAIVLSPIAFGLSAHALSHETAPEIFRPHVETEESIGAWRMMIVGIASIAPLLYFVDPGERSAGFRIVAALAGIGIAMAVFARVFGLLHNQEQNADRERKLASHLAALSGASASEIRALLVPIAEDLTDVRPIRIGPKTDGMVGYRLGSVLAEEPGEHLNLFSPARLNPQLHRAIATLVRDAELIAISTDAAARAAQQEIEAETNERIARNERRFRSLVQNASDVIMVVDPTGTITYVSDAIFSVLGYVSDEVVGTKAAAYLHRNDVKSAHRLFRTLIEDGTQKHIELRGRHSNGSPLLFEVVVTDMREVPEIEGFVLNLSDVTDRRKLERDLRNAETTDPLTLQLNRAAYIAELEVALRRTDISGVPLAIAVLDLNDFKSVNDALGPVLADRALVEVADRIRRSVRLNDIVARLSGDEFGILMPDGYTSVESVAAVERVLEAIRQPFVLEGRPVHLSATAGLSATNGEDIEALELLRQADTALSMAKETARSKALRFEEAMGRDLSQRLELRNGFATAIQDDELRLVYQPIISVASGQIRSLEALARWTHPRLGAVPPSTFIPIAEESDRINDVGEWALRTACEQIRTWDRSGIGGFTVSVNMSGYQLRDDSTVRHVEQILQETGADPKRLIVEITESVLIDDSDFTRRRIGALRALGVLLAIDDFGTGYSSLSYLQRYEFDILKIDKAFIEQLADPQNTREREIVKSIIGLARGLHAITVAEGIETAQEFEAVQELGCDYGQGYFFYRPLEVDAVTGALVEQRASVTNAA